MYSWLTLVSYLTLIIPALTPEDQDAVDWMFEDQAMDVHYDELLPCNGHNSDYEDNNNDNDNNKGLSGLSHHVPGW